MRNSHFFYFIFISYFVLFTSNASEFSIKNELIKAAKTTRCYEYRIEHLQAITSYLENSDEHHKQANAHIFKQIDKEVDDWKLITDFKNNYLHISGSYPTCGCQCSLTIKAYQKLSGDSVFLTEQKYMCDHGYELSANIPLADIFPKDFDHTLFFKSNAKIKEVADYFYIYAYISRNSAHIKLHLYPIPFGMIQNEKKPLHFSIPTSQSVHHNYGYILEAMNKIEENQNQILHNIRLGTFYKIDKDTRRLVEKVIKSNKGKNATLEDLQNDIGLLYKYFLAHQQLEFDQVTLEWCKQKGHFEVKNKHRPPIKSFFSFLKDSKFWIPLC